MAYKRWLNNFKNDYTFDDSGLPAEEIVRVRVVRLISALKADKKNDLAFLVGRVLGKLPDADETLGNYPVDVPPYRI